MTSEKKYDVKLHQKARKTITWGTFGKRGDEPLKIKTISELSTPHIMAIRLTQHQISNEMKEYFANEIAYREEHPECNITE